MNFVAVVPFVVEDHRLTGARIVSMRGVVTLQRREHLRRPEDAVEPDEPERRVRDAKADTRPIEVIVGERAVLTEPGARARRRHLDVERSAIPRPVPELVATCVAHTRIAGRVELERTMFATVGIDDLEAPDGSAAPGEPSPGRGQH